MNEEEQPEKLDFLKKLPSCMSNKMVINLTLDNWGTSEEVEKMLNMMRSVKTKEEAETILKDIMQKGALTNKYNKDLQPTLSGNSIGKITDHSAIKKSISPSAHWKAAGNIDHLFEHAIEPYKFELDKTRNNDSLEDRKYLYAPMEYEGRKVPVKMTVKKFKESVDGTRLYSAEVINHDLENKNRTLVNRKGKTNESVSPLPARRPNFNIP